jgi:hypothetical protein
MSITVSGLYVANWVDIVDASQLAVDLSLTTHKLCLLAVAATPNFSTDTAYSATNEVTGTNWPAGGIALSAAAAGGTSTAPTVSESPTGTLMYDMNDIAVAATTLTNARAAQLYANALAGKNAIVLVNFAADFSTNNGTFGIQLPTTGLFAVDLTP